MLYHRIYIIILYRAGIFVFNAHLELSYMDFIFRRTFSLVIFVLFLSACSSTSDTNKNALTQSNLPTQAITSSSPTPLAFEKVEDGSQALNTAILATSNAKPNEKITTSATRLTQGKVELVRYAFDDQNSLYVADFKNTLTFDYNKARIRDSDKPLINDFSTLYKNGTFGKYVYVIGHTDSDGTAAFNYGLSVRRARAVADILTNSQFPDSEINVIPAGEYLPKASNKTSKGRQINRRVEIVSAESRALIQAYIRQLKCPDNEKCKRKLLNIFDVRKTGKTTALSLNKNQYIATFSPELNNLKQLQTSLRSGSHQAEMQLLNNNDKRQLLKMGGPARTFSIPIEVRPVFKLPVEIRRGFRIPKQFIIKG